MFSLQLKNDISKAYELPTVWFVHSSWLSLACNYGTEENIPVPWLQLCSRTFKSHVEHVQSYSFEEPFRVCLDFCFILFLKGSRSLRTSCISGRIETLEAKASVYAALKTQGNFWNNRIFWALRQNSTQEYTSTCFIMCFSNNDCFIITHNVNLPF